MDRLAKGKTLFDARVLDAALAAPNNNDRHEALLQFKDSVLPHYDDVAEVFPEIRDKLKQTWLVAGDTDTVRNETPFGDYPGWEPHRVTVRISEIMQPLLHIDPDTSYTFIRDLFVQTSNPESRAQLLNLSKRLARPTIQIWKHVGPYVQVRLAEALSNEPDIAPIAPLATAIAREILRPDISGATWSSSTVTLSRGDVPYSQALQDARTTVVDVISRIRTGRH